MAVQWCHSRPQGYSKKIWKKEEGETGRVLGGRLNVEINGEKTCTLHTLMSVEFRFTVKWLAG